MCGSKPKPIKATISCCTARDLPVFLAALPRIERYIKPEEIVLCVPQNSDHIVEKVLQVSSKVKIFFDQDLINSEFYDLLSDDLTFGNNPGWLIQQLVKIKLAASYSDTDLVVIWDADTIPLRPISFFSQENKLKFFVGSEYYEPYFNTIKKMLNLDKIIEPSFIAQSLPAYSGWVKKFIVEAGGEKNWMENILFHSRGNSFSEYESLGTYFFACYPNEVTINWSRWERNGFATYRKSRRIDMMISSLQNQFSFVSLEHVDRGDADYFFAKISQRFQTFCQTFFKASDQ